MDGDIAELRGEVSQAQSAYQQGLILVEKLLSESGNFHRALGYLYVNQVEFERAEEQVIRLRHDAANGEIYKCTDTFSEATHILQEATAIFHEAAFGGGG